MTDKGELRERAMRDRDLQPDRSAKESAIMARLLALPEYRPAGLVATYVGIGSEVGTRDLIASRLERGEPTTVVYRTGNDLGLCLIESLDELAPASFGLWEPTEQTRQDPARQRDASQIDLFLVPGLAFDRSGGRIGYGRGYYDRLLRSAGSGPVFLALAFECQVVDRVPMEPNDIPVHLVVTEREVHRPGGSSLALLSPE